MRLSRKLIFQNLIGTSVFVIAVGALIYFGFHLRVSQTGSQNGEITGIVREKWIDVSETEQGSNIKPKALIETKTGEKIMIHTDRKTYDHIKIGAHLRRGTNGEIRTETD